jgi:putative CocE/NonD family hydrolase
VRVQVIDKSFEYRLIRTTLTLEIVKRLKIILNSVLIVTIYIVFPGCDQNVETEIQNIYIPTRDGVLLATDLYYPSSTKEQLPCILIRTPYGKSLLKEYGEFYCSNGFVVAIQDVRGKYDSEGNWEPYIHEGKDGFDVIEWLAVQDWSNGKVGMVGGSYSGSVQLAAALEAPPHLVTILPNITPATPFHNTPYENGAYALGWAVRWSDIVADNISGKEMNEKYQQVFTQNWYNELNHLPVIELDKKVLARRIDFWRDWIEHESLEGDYFGHQDYLKTIGKLDIPVFLQSGWFDVASRGTKLLYEALVKGGNDRVKLIVGPWVHSDRSSTQLGPMYLGKYAGIDLFEIYLRWFDFWLKEKENGIMDEPRVQLFNIGPNKWNYSDSYPLPDSKKAMLYLHSNKDGEALAGVLKPEVCMSVDSVLGYQYDPGDPTPSFQAFLKKHRTVEYKAYIESRSDVLVFESVFLEEPLTIAGPISMHLFASSSAVDTDFSISVMAIDSSNNIFPIGQTFGIMRAKFRDMQNPSLLEKGKVYEYNIDLSHTFYTLKPGEKLRVEISSCSFPEFARNLNTGMSNLTSTEYIVAEQQVYMSKAYPSHLEFYVY